MFQKHYQFLNVILSLIYIGTFGTQFKVKCGSLFMWLRSKLALSGNLYIKHARVIYAVFIID